MATTLGFKNLLDIPVWRQLARHDWETNAIWYVHDMRNNADQHPLMYLYGQSSSSIIYAYNPENDGWKRQIQSTSSTTMSFSASSDGTAVFAPSHGPRGSITTGNTTSKVVLSTGITWTPIGSPTPTVPPILSANALANRGDGRGYKIRVIGSSAGGSGKVEERIITASTEGSAGNTQFTQTWQVVAPSSFTNTTTAANNSSTADWALFPGSEVVGDYAAFGFPTKFSKLVFNYASGTAGVGGVVAWEYWNGTAWTALSGVSDATSSFTASVANGREVTWTMPTDWFANTLSNVSAFYVRARVTTTYTTNPVMDQGFVGGTITVTLDSALTFTPASGDTYEILSGKIYSQYTTSNLRIYDIVTGAVSTMSTTNYTSQSEPVMFMMDELYVPHNRNPSDGFFGTLTATASGASSLTGQAASGDASVLGNEYRNFQIRIVEDTATPTAVGQRGIIASHTAGASPVYTMETAWAVTPSSTAKYVIEYPNFLIYQGNSNTTTTYVYAAYAIGSMAADTWSSTRFAARSVARTSGHNFFGSFSIVPDADKAVRHSYCYSFRGGGPQIDVFDLAGGTNGAWIDNIPWMPRTTSQITLYGNSATQDVAANGGRYAYFICYENTGEMAINRFDMLTRQVEGFVKLPKVYSHYYGHKIFIRYFVDGATKIPILHVGSYTSNGEMWSTPIFR